MTTSKRIECGSGYIEVRLCNGALYLGMKNDESESASVSISPDDARKIASTLNAAAEILEP